MSVNPKTRFHPLILVIDKIIDAYKLGKALDFGKAYMHEHHDTRAGALRVSAAALRFLRGDDVTTINAEADRDRLAKMAALKKAQDDKKWWQKLL